MEVRAPILTEGSAHRLKPETPRHIPGLDELRGIAVLLVMHHHMSSRIVANDIPSRLFRRLGGLGFCGVDLFFVLSGFLITSILLAAKGGAGYYRSFYARRILRIFPLYYLVVFAWCRLLPALGLADIDLIAHARWWLCTYLTNIPPALANTYRVLPPGTAHFWSLAVEEQFYLVWPWLILRVREERMLLVCTWIAASALILRSALFLTGWHLAAITLTFARADMLAAGAAIAVFARAKKLAGMRRGAIRLAVGSGVVFVASRLTSDVFNTSAGLAIVGAVSAFLFFPSIVVIVLTQPTKLGSRLLAFAGRHSYAAYLLHFPLIEVLLLPGLVERWPSVFQAGLAGQLWLFSLTVASTYLLSFAVWHLFEKHFLEMKRYFNYQPARGAQPGE